MSQVGIDFPLFLKGIIFGNMCLWYGKFSSSNDLAKILQLFQCDPGLHNFSKAYEFLSVATKWQNCFQEKCSHYQKDGNLCIFMLEFEEQQNHR